MKKNDIKKLKERNAKDLERDLAEAREELRALKFDLAAGKVKNVRAINENKKKIARIMTFLNIAAGLKAINK